MRRNTYIRFEELCRKFKGYVGTKELLEEGFSNRQIAVLEEEGYLEKICHGYYWLKGKSYGKPMDYKCIEICLSDPRAVVCERSALYYQGVIQEEPEVTSVATCRTDRRLIKMYFPIKRYYFSENNFEVGIRRKETEFGCYNIYDVERSVCDVLRLKVNFDFEIVNKRNKNKRQYERLVKYAELLRVKDLS